MRSHLLRLLIACLWTWATLIPLRAIPLWVFAGGSTSEAPTLPGAVDMLAWWDFEANGNDSTANARNATLVGSGAYIAGLVGNAMEASTTGEYHSIADATWMRPAADFSIFGWFKADDGNPDSTSRAIVSQYGSSAGNQAYLLALGTSGVMSFTVGDGSGTHSAVSTTTLTNGAQSAWVFVVGVFVASTSVTLYVNGVVDGTPDTTGIPSRAIDSSTAFQIGARDSNAGTTLVGLIDSVGFANKALSAEEVEALYNAGAGVDFADLP